MEVEGTLAQLKVQVEAAFEMQNPRALDDVSEESLEDYFELYWYFENVRPEMFGEGLIEVIRRWERNAGHEAGIRAIVCIGDYWMGLYPELEKRPFEFTEAQEEVFRQFIIAAADRPEYQTESMVQTTRSVLLDPD